MLSELSSCRSATKRGAQASFFFYTFVISFQITVGIIWLLYNKTRDIKLNPSPSCQLFWLPTDHQFLFDYTYGQLMLLLWKITGYKKLYVALFSVVKYKHGLQYLRRVNLLVRLCFVFDFMVTKTDFLLSALKMRNIHLHGHLCEYTTIDIHSWKVRTLTRNVPTVFAIYSLCLCVCWGGEGDNWSKKKERKKTSSPRKRMFYIPADTLSRNTAEDSLSPNRLVILFSGWIQV